MHAIIAELEIGDGVWLLQQGIQKTKRGPLVKKT